MKIGLWAKTQIEFETEVGKSIATEIIETGKDSETKKKVARTPLEIDVRKHPLKTNSFVGKPAKREFKTIKKVLFWSYANLGMAHKAVNDKSERYTRLHFAIRSKLFKGLMTGTMNPRSLFLDEKDKLKADRCCVYCGNTKHLQIDHIIPKNKGGKDAGENLVWACRKCNASKNDLDLMEWFSKKDKFPPIHILRNYMKLVMQYCNDNNLLDYDMDSSCKLNLPFAIEFVPLDFPKPTELIKRHETQLI